MRVCLTGATGFIGAALLQRLDSFGYETVALARRIPARKAGTTNWIEYDLTQNQNPFLNSGPIDTLVHLAGRAHVLDEKVSRPINEFRRINVDATVHLARSAIEAGATRFVFVSTIGVHGTALHEVETVTENSPIFPEGPYAQSKYEAEEALRQIALESRLELVIVRPVLVAGAGAPGNLMRLARLITFGFPLPVPSRDNARSFVSLRNLTNLLQICLEHPASAGQTFIAAEAEWPSTCQAIRWIAEGMNKQVRTVSTPDALLRIMVGMVGKGNLYEKLFGNLRADAAKARELLGWEPIEDLADALRAVGKGFLA